MLTLTISQKSKQRWLPKNGRFYNMLNQDPPCNMAGRPCSAPCSSPFTWWLWCDVHVHDDNWAQDQWRAHVWARADSRGARPAWKEPQFLRLVMFLMECRSVCGICIILYFWTWWVFGHTHIFFASCSLIYSCESRKVKGEELWFDERFNIIWLARHTMCLIRDCLASNISTS